MVWNNRDTSDILSSTIKQKEPLKQKFQDNTILLLKDMQRVLGKTQFLNKKHRKVSRKKMFLEIRWTYNGKSESIFHNN